MLEIKSKRIEGLFRKRSDVWIYMAVVFLGCGWVQGQDMARPKLQIINGTQRAVDVYWIKSDKERVFNASVSPGINHRLAPR